MNVPHSVRLSLLSSRTKEVHNDSGGLNWGRRPGRNSNEAYIHVPAHIGRSKFFPDHGIEFTVHNDDGSHLTCVRVQGGGKGIQSRPSNSDIGEYFRRRLEVDSGERVETADLIGYGRTDVTFTARSDGSYDMDFSV